MDTCRWNPGSTRADGHFATGISWVWILPQRREAICYQADFLLCSWVAFNFCKTPGPYQANRIYWSEVEIEYGVNCTCNLWWWTDSSEKPCWMLFWSTTSVSSCSSSALRFQGGYSGLAALLSCSLCDTHDFPWKFWLSAFGLNLGTIFESFQNVPEVAFTSACVQRLWLLLSYNWFPHVTKEKES